VGTEAFDHWYGFRLVGCCRDEWACDAEGDCEKGQEELRVWVHARNLDVMYG